MKQINAVAEGHLTEAGDNLKAISEKDSENNVVCLILFSLFHLPDSTDTNTCCLIRLSTTSVALLSQGKLKEVSFLRFLFVFF